MSYTDPNSGLFDDIMFPFIDNTDWDAFFDFEPKSDDSSFPGQDPSLTQWEHPGPASQEPPLLVPSAPRSLATNINSQPVAEPSASLQLTTNGNAIKKNQTKRELQDCISSFSIDESSVAPPRKRQAFSPNRRTEVAKIRRIKACQRCKMRKLSCQSSGVCSNCIISAAEDIALGEKVCFRCTLVDLRFGTGDLLRQSQSRDLIDKLPPRTYSVLQTIFVWFRSEYIHNALRLEVQDYSENPNDNDQVIVFTVTANDPSQPQFSTFQTPKYTIINQSLPSVAQLDEWIQQQVDRGKPGWSPAARLFDSFHTLLDIHCNNTSDAHCKEFLKAALRITNLYECWRNVLSAEKTQLPTPTSYISRAAGIQIALIAKQGIADCEIQILSKLDDLIQKSKRPSKESELCIWAGVWTLILLYRDILRRYLNMSQGKLPPVFKYETSIFLARQMYNALTSTYNLLFRNKSPLTLDWRDDENFARIGRNTETRDLLNLIKEQTQVMYDQSFDLGDDDHILQSLVAEQQCTLPSPVAQSLTYGTVGETSISFPQESLYFDTDSGGGGGFWGRGRNHRDNWDPVSQCEPRDPCYGGW